MKNLRFLTFKPCEGCDDVGMQVQDSGPLRGMIRMCPLCGSSYKKWINQYGTDYKNERQGIYIDNSVRSRPIVKKANTKEFKF